MIQLSQYEKNIILFCKGHLRDKYPSKHKWVNSLKPLFKNTFGWNPNIDLNAYRRGAFLYLFDIYMKIQLDRSGSNYQLKELFSAIMFKTPWDDDSKPIDRGIAKLCALIQNTQVVMEDGTHRFDLTYKDTE